MARSARLSAASCPVRITPTWSLLRAVICKVVKPAQAALEMDEIVAGDKAAISVLLKAANVAEVSAWPYAMSESAAV